MRAPQLAQAFSSVRSGRRHRALSCVRPPVAASIQLRLPRACPDKSRAAAVHDRYGRQGDSEGRERNAGAGAASPSGRARSRAGTAPGARRGSAGGLRRLLIGGAVTTVCRGAAPASPRLMRMLTRQPGMLVAVAPINCMARMAWALTTKKRFHRVHAAVARRGGQVRDGVGGASKPEERVRANGHRNGVEKTSLVIAPLSVQERFGPDPGPSGQTCGKCNCVAAATGDRTHDSARWCRPNRT